jgi:hypothetical protein
MKAIEVVRFHCGAGELTLTHDQGVRVAAGAQWWSPHRPGVSKRSISTPEHPMHPIRVGTCGWRYKA